MSAPPDPAPRRLPGDDSREALMVQVSRMVHLQDMTHTEVARRTGLNRWQVARLLEEARDRGILRIEIVPTSRRQPALEARLVAAFGLDDAVVVPAAADRRAVRDGVAQAAGQYLAALRPAPRMVGVSWGRTMAAVAHWLPEGWAEGVEVVQANGTVAPVPGSLEPDARDAVAETFARKGRGRFVPLPVPAIVGRAETRAVLEADRIVADVLARARAAPLVCFSLGAMGADSALLVSGNITPDEHARLAVAGAVGDILGRFVDAEGAIAAPDIDARTIGLTLEDLRVCPRTLAVVAGPEKLSVTRAALAAGLVRVLVTDADLATRLVELRHVR